MAQSHNRRSKSALTSSTGLVLVGFLGVAGYLLWAEHQAHILAYLPLILFLGVCLGMHSFMHGGHGKGHGADNDAPEKEEDR